MQAECGLWQPSYSGGGSRKITWAQKLKPCLGHTARLHILRKKEKKYKGREVIDEAWTCSCVWKSAMDWGDGFKAAVTLQPIAGGTNMACIIFQPVSLLLPSWTVSSLSFLSPWCWVIYRISLVSEWTITTRFLLFSIHSHTNFIVCWRRSRILAPAGGFEIKEME